MTIERAILLIVGVVVVGSVVMAVVQSYIWLSLTTILGAHLIQAAFTGYCPIVMFLKKIGLPSKSAFE